jgi:hypothetical protein
LISTPDFDPLAHIYRWLEWITFGPYLHRCRVAFLPRMRTAGRALVMGDGDGRFTQQLLAANPSVEVHAVDSSRAMLDQLMRRAGKNAVRVHTEQVDARLWKPGNHRYDLVATHFFLDCFSTSEVERIATQIGSATEQGALWAISDFHVPDSLFGRVVALPVVKLLYLGFRILTGLGAMSLPEHHPALKTAGFVCRERTELLGGLLIAELWSQADHQHSIR